MQSTKNSTIECDEKQQNIYYFQLIELVESRISGNSETKLKSSAGKCKFWTTSGWNKICPLIENSKLDFLKQMEIKGKYFSSNKLQPLMRGVLFFRANFAFVKRIRSIINNFEKTENSLRNIFKYWGGKNEKSHVLPFN